MRQTTIDLHTAPAYQILAAAGKTVLRPGGRSATEKLFAWANFQPGETVLELASGLGISAISLAKRYGVRVVIQIFQDEGMINSIRLFWNILSHPVLRDRVLTIRRVLTQHRQNLGYVTLYAVLHQLS